MARKRRSSISRSRRRSRSTMRPCTRRSMRAFTSCTNWPISLWRWPQGALSFSPLTADKALRRLDISCMGRAMNSTATSMTTRMMTEVCSTICNWMKSMASLTCRRMEARSRTTMMRPTCSLSLKGEVSRRTTLPGGTSAGFRTLAGVAAALSWRPVLARMACSLAMITWATSGFINKPLATSLAREASPRKLAMRAVFSTVLTRPSRRVLMFFSTIGAM